MYYPLAENVRALDNFISIRLFTTRGIILTEQLSFMDFTVVCIPGIAANRLSLEKN